MAAHQVSPRSVKETNGIWTERRAKIGERHGLLTQRVRASLTEEETELLIEDGIILNAEIRKLRIKKISKIHPKQEEAAKVIIDEFSDLEKVMMLALGLTQSGKTGVMASLIQKAVTSDHPIPVENIFIITALSDLEWKAQTKARFPHLLENNIFHRQNLEKAFVEKIRGKKNVLVLVDEVQVACKTDQTLAKTLKKCGFLDLQVLLSDDVKIVEFSATPNGTLYDLEDWGSHAGKCIIKPGEGYMSAMRLRDQGRIFQSCSLVADYGFEVEPAYEDILKQIRKFDDDERGPLWHIIRTPTGTQQTNMKVLFSAFLRKRGVDITGAFKNYDQLNGPRNKPTVPGRPGKLTNDLNDWLKGPPPTGKHTFIFIKEKSRCAKTFIKKHIGIWYERQPQIASDDVVTQGLLGRATGYDDNGFSVVFTNKESITKYETLWNSRFEANVDWISSTTKHKQDQEIVSTGTANGMLSNGGVVVSPEIIKPVWEGLQDTHEIKDHFKEYDGDWNESSLKLWWDNFGFNSHFPFSKKKLDKMNGWAYCVDHQLGGGSKKVKTKKQIQDRVKKLDAGTWKLQSMGWKKNELDTKPLPGLRQSVKKAFVCYESFDEDQKQKPVIYWRELRHK